jgi:transcriptional regulator with XRE-family HTH domain
MEYKKSKSKTETIGDKIKKIRLKQGLTQDKLARKADIPYTTLTKIESSVITKPSIQTVVKIAKGLDITLDELVK